MFVKRRSSTDYADYADFRSPVWQLTLALAICVICVICGQNFWTNEKAVNSETGSGMTALF
jgi:hypothetical protein